MLHRLTATIQALEQHELDEMIEPIVLKYVKEHDPDPEIRVYSIGHEGKANLHLPGIGPKTFTWIQAAIQWVFDKVRLGTAVFNRHDPDTNNHEGRIQIGEVIGKSVKKIGDRLNTLAAIHIFPKYKSRPLDIASFEAEMEFDHDGVQAWPTQIKNVSGIALSNSDIDTPGFPGATLLGAVQAYVQAFKSDLGEKTMNKSDVLTGAKELGLKPSQVFDIDDIMADLTVDKKVKDVTKDHFAMAKRLGEERDKFRDRVANLENEKADSDKRLQTLQMNSKSSSVIDTMFADPECKLSVKEKAFAKHGLKKAEFTAVDDAELKTEMDTYVSKSVEEFKEISGVLGIDIKTNTPDPSAYKLPPELTMNSNQPTVLPPSPSTLEKGTNSIIMGDMNPDTNMLIPGGKASLEASKT